MARLRYAAKNEILTSPQYPFFSVFLLIGFVICSIISMVAVFPGNDLQQTLMSQADSSDVEFRYSLILLQKTKHSDITYSSILKNPSNAIQQLDKARISPNQQDSLWLNYVTLRGIVFYPKFNREIKSQAKQVMVNYFDTFKNKPISELQDKQLAKDALAINQASKALYFYEQILQKNPNQPLYFYSNIAKTASWAKQCVKSADYFLMGQQKSASLLDKRYFLFSAIDELVACDRPQLALKIGKENINGLEDDIDTYQKLIDIAISGAQPGEAKEFLFKLLQLKANKKQ